MKLVEFFFEICIFEVISLVIVCYLMILCVVVNELNVVVVFIENVVFGKYILLECIFGVDG